MSWIIQNNHIRGYPNRSKWTVSKENSKPSGWKILTFSFFPLKSVTNDQEWRLYGCSVELQKRNTTAPLSLRNLQQRRRRKWDKKSQLFSTLFRLMKLGSQSNKRSGDVSGGGGEGRVTWKSFYWSTRDFILVAGTLILKHNHWTEYKKASLSLKSEK